MIIQTSTASSAIEMLDTDQAKKIVRKGMLLIKISIVYTLMKSALGIFAIQSRLLWLVDLCRGFLDVLLHIYVCINI